MTDKAITRDTDGSFTKASATKEVPAYIVEVTGASVAANSSISLVHRYCDKLPREKYGYFLPPLLGIQKFTVICCRTAAFYSSNISFRFSFPLQ